MRIAAGRQVPHESGEVARLVSRATSLLERIRSATSIAPGFSDSPGTSIEEPLLERWCKVVGEGDWEKLRKRLRWDGLNLSKVRALLAAPPPTELWLPSWAE